MSIESEEKYFDVPCCCCDQPLREGGTHINWAYLPKKAEWDSPVTGNVAYDIPAEYAMALVCDECYENDEEIQWVLKGEDLERVDPDELEDLQPMHERIIESLPDDLVEGGYAALENLFTNVSGRAVPKAETARFLGVNLGIPPDEGALVIDRLVHDDRLEEEGMKDGLKISLVDQ